MRQLVNNSGQFVGLSFTIFMLPAFVILLEAKSDDNIDTIVNMMSHFVIPPTAPACLPIGGVGY